MAETLAPPPVEATRVETSGLLKTRQLTQRYKDTVTSEGQPNLDLVNGLLKRNGIEIKQIVKDTIPGSIAQSEVVVRTDATNILLDKLMTRGRTKLGYDSSDDLIRVMVREGAEEFTTQTAEERVNQDFDELKEVLQFQQYVDQVIEQTDSPFAYKLLQQKIAFMAGMYKRSALNSIAKRGDEMFAEDVLGEDVPYLKEGLNGENLVWASSLLNAIKAVMIAAKSPNDLRKKYAELFWPLDEQKGELIRKYGTFQNYSGDLQAAIKKFSSIRMDGWQSLVITPEQTKKIYDIVSLTLLRNLFAGGHESWEGTGASSIFYTLHDPRVLPHLIEHLRRFGAGHTTNSVVYTIEEIVKNPLDKKDLDQVLTQAQPLQRRILNNWFLDSSKASYKIAQETLHGMSGGYSIASMIQQVEQYMPRGDLLDVAREVAESQGKEVDWEVMQAFFHNNQYVDTSWVEDTLLQDLDKVATIIAKSGVADWRESSKKVFNALINPTDGQISKFPKIISSEGLSLGTEELERIEKLYQSGDLKRGVMARTSFAEGLLFLASKEDGSTIARDILAASTGANRDSERIRDIFNLLRSLDSFGGFEFTKRATLTEIASDLKGKLVAVVGEKMELTGAEASVLNDKLFDLMKTGIFEIIPHLLARFHEQGKEDVARVVRDIGKHIVLGDFREWRNNLDTAKAQLSVLPQEKQAAWINPGPEVTLEIGVTKGTEAKKGAIAAIRRIASEAKAHILEVYKLDFSTSGINVLRQKQQDLVQALKDTTRDAQERKDLGESKRGIDNQIRVIEGLLGLENLTPESLNPIQLTKYVAGLVNSINSFPGLDQAASDLNQIAEVLTTQAEIANVTRLRAYDTDDPLALLKVGVEPRETCQSYRSGSYNFCLPAYVADANKRAINVENDKGEILGRSVMKLTHIRDENGQTHPAILLEPIYTTSEIAPVYRGVVKIALEKAKAVGAYLILTGDMAIPTGANHERTIPVVETESKNAGMRYGREDVDIFIPKSVNSYEYSDSLGGAISYFERYRDLSNAVAVKP